MQTSSGTRYTDAPAHFVPGITYSAVAKHSAPTTRNQQASGPTTGVERTSSRIPDQRSTGKTNGVQTSANLSTPIRGVLTTSIGGAVLETPITTTHEQKMVALYEATNRALKEAATCKEKLHQGYYKSCGLKPPVRITAPVTRGQSDPIQVRTTRTSQDIGHYIIPEVLQSTQFFVFTPTPSALRTHHTSRTNHTDPSECIPTNSTTIDTSQSTYTHATHFL